MVRARLMWSVAEEAPGLVLDLSHVEYLDSSGLHMLVDTHMRLDERGKSLRVVVPEGTFVAHLVEVTGLERIVAVDRSVAAGSDALAR